MAATLADGDGGTAAAAVRHSKEKQQNKSGKESTPSLATKKKANEGFSGDNEGHLRMKTFRSFAGRKRKSVPSSKARKRGKKSPKAQARDIRRLLRKKRETLPAAAAEELEERACRLEKEAQQARKEAKRKRFFSKRKTLYDKIRFYEAQKVRRRLKATRQLLQQLLKQQRQELRQQKDSSLVENDALKASIAEQQAALASHLSDLTYVLHYPPDEPYIALFPCGGLVSEDTEQKREAMRLKIRQQIIEERLGALGSAAEEDEPGGGFMLSAAEARQAAAATAAAAVSVEGNLDVPNKSNSNTNLQREQTAVAAFDDKEEECSNQNVEDEAFTVTALFEQAPELSDAEEHSKPHLKMPRKTRVPSQTLHTSSSSFASSARPRKNPDFSGRRQGRSKHAPSLGEKRGPVRVISDKSRRPIIDERKTTHLPEHTSFPDANSRSTATRWFPLEKGDNKQDHVHTAASVAERRSAATGSKRETHSNSGDDKTGRSSRHEAENRKKRKLGSGPLDSSSSFSSSGLPSGVALSSATKRIGLSKSAAVGSHVIFESDSD